MGTSASCMRNGIILQVFDFGKGNPDDLAPCFLQFPGLVQRLLKVLRVRLQHGLDNYRVIAPYGHISNLDCLRFLPFYHIAQGPRKALSRTGRYLPSS